MDKLYIEENISSNDIINNSKSFYNPLNIPTIKIKKISIKYIFFIIFVIIFFIHTSWHKLHS